MTITIDDVDLFDLDRFQRGEHHEMLRVLRKTGRGIHWLVDPEGEGFWCVTRMAHVREVNRQPQIFSSNRNGTQIRTPAPDDARSQMMRDSLMIDMDAPKHTRYRMLVSGGFTPRMVSLLEAYVGNRAKMAVDAVCERGACDFVPDLAAELPLQAIADMMSIPDEDRRMIFRWANTLIGYGDPEFVGSMDDIEAVFVELSTYSHALQAERRANPRDDILTVLLNAEVDGSRLTEFEFDMFFLLLCLAGSETTRNTLSDGIYALVTNPDQWARFKEHPDALMDTTVEESLRWSTPVLHFRRTATQDYDLDGVQIREGDKVVYWLASANRDERAFDDPYRFDIDRNPNEHVTFGAGGPHYCIGANLARMEMRVMFREIAARMPDLTLAGEPEYVRANFLRGMKHMPVTFTPSPSTNTQPTEYIGYTKHTRSGSSRA
jgi:cholest-4-en-3-one 26-monooxygenase